MDLVTPSTSQPNSPSVSTPPLDLNSPLSYWVTRPGRHSSLLNYYLSDRRGPDRRRPEHQLRGVGNLTPIRTGVGEVWKLRTPSLRICPPPTTLRPHGTPYGVCRPSRRHHGIPTSDQTLVCTRWGPRRSSRVTVPSTPSAHSSDSPGLLNPRTMNTDF